VKNSSKKLTNIIYAVIFVIIIIIGGILVNKTNKTDWNNRINLVSRCSDFAVSSFYSTVEMQRDELTDERIDVIEKQLMGKMDETISDIQITKEFPEDIIIDNQTSDQSVSYYASKNDKLTYYLIRPAEHSGSIYYIILKSDFTELSHKELKSWYIYAGSAAALIILATALIIAFNLLWKESDKNKKFMENFTHELKTPMTSILGYSDMIKNYDLSLAEHDKAADALYFEATRLNNLSAQMLDIFVMQNDEIQLSEISSKELEEDIRIPLDTLSRKYGIDYDLKFDTGDFLGNRELLVTLITNLADNAFKATVNANKTEKVTIAGKMIDTKYYFEVIDNGIGISKEHIKKITEPFYREDKARSRKQGGAGLGLTLCNEIAKRLDTELLFSSVKGCGTTVSFELERSDE